MAGAVAGALALVGVRDAGAVPLWDLVIGPGDMQNNFNVPKLTLRNQSTAGERIVEMRLGVGDPDFVFDFVADLGSNPAGRAANVATEALTGATLVVGDRVNNVGSYSEVVWSFVDFAPGEALVFEIDVDPRVGGPTADARRVLFDNGSDPNAVLVVRFDDGSMVIRELPDAGTSQASYAFSGSAAVPEPSGLVLLAGGFAALSAGRRRVRRGRCVARPR